MKLALRSALLLVMLFAATPAAAERSAASASDVKRAAEEYDRGRDAYRAEQYVEAAERFEAADAHAPSAAALRLAILSRKEAGQLARAATLAALGLERHADDSALTELANGVIEEAKTLQRTEVSCDEPCELVMDDKIVHGRPSRHRVLYMEAGSHRITASWAEGRTKSESLEATEGNTTQADFFAPPSVDTETAADPVDSSTDESTVETDEGVQPTSKGGWSPTVFWTGLGLTAVGLGATTYLGLYAVNNPGEDAVRSKCVGQGTSCPEYQEGKDNERNANIALGATAAIGVFTAITGLFLTDWDSGKEAAPSSDEMAKSAKQSKGIASLHPWISVGGGATVGASGTF